MVGLFCLRPPPAVPETAPAGRYPSSQRTKTKKPLQNARFRAQPRIFFGMTFVAFPLRRVIEDVIIRARPFDFVSDDAIPITAKPQLLLERRPTLFVNAFDVSVGRDGFKGLHHAAQRTFCCAAEGCWFQFLFVRGIVKNQNSMKMVRHHDPIAQFAKRKTNRQIEPLLFHHSPRVAEFQCAFITQQTPAPTNNNRDEIRSRPRVIVGRESRERRW